MQKDDHETKVVHLVQPPCSIETIRTFELYLELARKGEIVGAAFIVLKPGGGYDVDVTGEAGQQPEFVRGLTGVLEDQLAKIIGSR